MQTARDDVDQVEVRDPAQGRLAVPDHAVGRRDHDHRRAALRQRFPNCCTTPPSDDICYATQNRQTRGQGDRRGRDLVIVVGSGNSSNSVRLVEVALEGGARAAQRVDAADELREEWFDGVTTVGVTSGASVPEVLVRGVLDALAERGFPTAQEVRTAEETLIFSLPRELRRDLKRAPAPA